MPIKTTMRYQIPTGKMTVFKRKRDKYWQRCREKGTLVYCWWESNWYSHYGKQHGGSSKN